MSNEWQKPVRVNDGGLTITVASAAQARTFLQHAKRSDQWGEAWAKCSAAAEGRLSNDEARQAFLKAAH
ncbi:DUF982 domain-containing protein [Neorhizobium alkalisoli]|uniref:Uncharacterized protein DUF982 n=1 Tax=Neorhizobium alkalisoli TaxID=528178 RepID=A0A561QSN4_9HYPH|nr:DUF982 domain-containing protein [Neorhizobium alkalisoli]TWF53312.1 uncharacterized protein DUF982 [Neorhizobium alkalisoli]